MERIILDTNVLIDGIQDENSHAFRIINLCLEGELQPIISHQIRKEYELIVSQLITDDEYLTLLDEYYTIAENIHVRTRKKIVEEDDEDNKFVQTAIDGKVKHIISSDRHLLDIGLYNGIYIVTPKEFWNKRIGTQETEEEFQEWAQNIGIR
ncbi:MAG: putative toxin-antitoxin system toxin component, PIN family [Candidatus Kerfeldbacteria bacterium RIFCSPHIGHO2_02_FULL_42_14]|uniref:Putative toxin-antitoxin system toxin component, PIN family n=1 Tax=Candidatus Kerfeldbacteria bacterium RIFCSPHIGHO2_02_FULL_42_14 TaxID=1798540 RepID=A0A1G2ARZ0_9BACT|nr:MAG: putative toxin-antitoxin system toxin component, PIN family [Candidatus Kerfeldbacteria bacterium RIFCSPHIGHO2_02_FULL_42_14]OGY81943.1 MAG: putative toxin-antitoxin system toxin component, PIN family [Candidatus Kerfeldbacteria bacterium RIFCSPHIGHO2_12_FULL_42_13]OGY83422.1 MAG: putative toxin-antitoxin system toxin component, PIN family [Candidatus Kerfeldbacteria bacterium RIFCSPLOWO2_02_FULL_42_19]OGY85567.1 MAG: putative toxin-antitoxin system toxin component, PIN family [Candidatu